MPLALQDEWLQKHGIILCVISRLVRMGQECGRDVVGMGGLGGLGGDWGQGWDRDGERGEAGRSKLSTSHPFLGDS